MCINHIIGFGNRLRQMIVGKKFTALLKKRQVYGINSLRRVVYEKIEKSALHFSCFCVCF